MCSKQIWIDIPREGNISAIVEEDVSSETRHSESNRKLLLMMKHQPLLKSWKKLKLFK